MELLNQQIAALRRQLGALEEALDASESRNTESQTQIADLGQRLNVALAQRVQELSRYRSDFFGKLRQILADRPDIEVVGDRFVLPASVLFSTASDDLSDPARGELNKLADAIGELESQIPPDINWVIRVDGHTDARPIATDEPLPVELGAVGGARHRRGALSDRSRHQAGASRRRGLRRISAARSGRRRRRLRPQPPHRAEADGAVEPGPTGLTLFGGA